MGNEVVQLGYPVVSCFSRKQTENETAGWPRFGVVKRCMRV